MLPAPETKVARSARPVPSRALIEGPSAWIGADMRGREAEWAYCLPPEIAEIEAAVKAVRAQPRHRRYPPRGLTVADARTGAGPAARRAAQWPRLCVVARCAGRRSADRRGRGGLLGHRNLFWQ